MHRNDDPRLYLPHRELENRAFVLVPLAELRPELVLPSGRPIAERASELAATQPLRVAGATMPPWPRSFLSEASCTTRPERAR